MDEEVGRIVSGQMASAICMQHFESLGAAQPLHMHVLGIDIE